jgi:predicted enzyme related to lactoylglutathione lyase
MLVEDAVCVRPRGPDNGRNGTMEGRIAGVPLVVTNKARALEFYTEKVGFEKKTDVTGPGGYRYVTVGPKGQDLELVLYEVGSAVDPSQKEVSKNWSPARAPPLMLTVADCRKVHQEVSSRGVRFLGEPQENPWSTVATFQDPDGNLFTLTQFSQTTPKK